MILFSADWQIYDKGPKKGKDCLQPQEGLLLVTKFHHELKYLQLTVLTL